MKNKLLARGGRAPVALQPSAREHFYVPTPIDSNDANKSVADNLDNIQSTLLNMFEEFKKDIDDLKRFESWPIGSTFISLDDVNPRERVGYGNWVLVSEGKCLVGAGAGKVLGQTGGNTEVVITEAQMPAHVHNVTVNAYHGVHQTDIQGGVRQTDGQGSHTHELMTAEGTESGGFVSLSTNRYGNQRYGRPRGQSMYPEGHHAHNIDINHAHNIDISHAHSVGENVKGSSAPINIESPYLVVNIWNRVS